MNDIKDKLRDYKIQPSAKAWEKIENALDKEKKSSAAIIYFRWAAAASVAMLITSYALFNNIPLGAGVADLSGKEIKTDFVKDSSIQIPESRNNNGGSLVNANSERIAAVKNKFSVQGNTVALTTKNELSTQNNTVTAFEDKSYQSRNTAALASLNTAIPSVTHNRASTIYPDLPEFSTALLEDARIHRKWMNLLSEDLTEERDSTLTERALDLANKKTVTLFQSNIKPMLLDWYRSRIKL
ncbi:MAG: hypothetical protein ACOYOA_04220 [Saprospiraceae bacterium]